MSALAIASVPTPLQSGKRRCVEESAEGESALVRRMLKSHDAQLRVLTGWAEDAYKLPKQSALARELLATTASWNKMKPEKGPHPKGHIKASIMSCFLLFSY